MGLERAFDRNPTPEGEKAAQPGPEYVRREVVEAEGGRFSGLDVTKLQTVRAQLEGALFAERRRMAQAGERP